MGAVHSSQIAEADKKLQQLDTELQTDQTLVTTAKQYDSIKTVSEQMNKILSNRFTFLPTWADVKASVPKDMQFSNVTMSADHHFIINGDTRSISSVANFTKSLSNRAEFTLVTPHSIDKDSESGKFSFSMSFTAKPKSVKGGTQ